MGGGARPPSQSDLDRRGEGRPWVEGAAPFPSPSPPLSPFPLSVKRKNRGGANPSRSGVLVGLPPPLARPWWPASSSLLYIRGQGAPQRQNIVLAVCSAPLHRLLL